MKNPLSLLLVTILIVTGLGAKAQSESEKLDLPGDNLNLYAVMKIFQESPTLEGFEKALNDQKSEINNLDLNGDKLVDYIRVNDNINNNIHTITLDVAVNEYEDQDLAVIFVEKRENGQILIQLMGDEDLYGKDYFIEPADQTFRERPNSGYSADKNAASTKFTGPNAVAAWPIVKFLITPGYVTWPSPWRWGSYPAHWRPWAPQFWHSYYAYQYHLRSYYNAHFRRSNYFRNPTWFSNYYGGNIRSRSVTVRTRLAKGDYKVTYSKPGSAAEGHALFARKNAKMPSSKETAPSFDKTGKPIPAKAAEPSAIKSETKKASVGMKTVTPGKKGATAKKTTRKSGRQKAGSKKSRIKKEPGKSTPK